MTKNKYFVKLSWKLLEAKVNYYLRPERVKMSDAEYDFLEKRYLRLCKSLGKENTIQSMVGVDMNRPSVRFILNT